jgi:hypothetical protein
MWEYQKRQYMLYVDVALLCGCKGQVHPAVISLEMPLVICPVHMSAEPYVIDPWQMSA